MLRRSFNTASRCASSLSCASSPSCIVAIRSSINNRLFSSAASSSSSSAAAPSSSSFASFAPSSTLSGIRLHRLSPAPSSFAASASIHNHRSFSSAASSPAAASPSSLPPSTLSSILSSSFVSPDCPPLNLLVLGAGLSGLTLAQQLQRRFQEQHRRNVRITIIEKSGRVGGWVNTEELELKQSSASPSSAPSFPPSSTVSVERGPRSFLYRAGLAASDSTVELFRQLHLGPRVLLADKSSARRFLWNKDATSESGGKVVALPSSIFSKAFFAFPHTMGIIKGIRAEWYAPQLVSDDENVMDESIRAFMLRRTNSTLADDMIDPMVAGIYAGRIDRLSMQSCFSRLPLKERRSGGMLRDGLQPSAQSQSEFKAQAAEEHRLELDAIYNKSKQEPWIARVKNHSHGYSLRGGTGTLIKSLLARLEARDDDPYGRLLGGDAPEVNVEYNTTIDALSIDESNKPVLISTMANGDECQRTFDHVFTTLPSHELHSILSSSCSSLPLSPNHFSSLLSTLSRDSMPSASVWVVHIIYAGELLSASQRGFGLLVPSGHNIAGMEALGIAYDSNVYPQQNTKLTNTIANDDHNAASSSTDIVVQRDDNVTPTQTRFTVMLGGDRHPHLLAYSNDDICTHAKRVLDSMLPIVSAHVPIVVDAYLNVDCIPQYYVGHAAKTHRVHELLKHLAYTPASFTLPTSRPLDPLIVDEHAASIRSRENATDMNPAIKPISLLGTSLYGVSLNDCIHHAMTTAKSFVASVTPKKEGKEQVKRAAETSVR